MEYEICKKTGTPYAVIKRKKGREKTDNCPFCNSKHIHSIGDGHRISHCADHKNPKKVIVASDGTVLKKENGYILRSY